MKKIKVLNDENKKKYIDIKAKYLFRMYKYTRT